jgi:hypothetical protein
MRQDMPDNVRECVDVLFSYLNGEGPLDAALSAWRTMQVADEEDDESELEEAALLGIDRDALHPAQQARLTTFLERLDETSGDMR